MNLSSTLEHDVTTGVSSVHELEIDSVIPNPNQPRKIFNDESIQELASSLQRHGLLEPIVVKDALDGTYMILAGERRYRASVHAGFRTIKAIIDTRADEYHDLHEKALIENIQRENLTDFEIALEIDNLWNTKHYASKKELAEAIGKSQSYLSKCFGVLEKLDSWILKEFKQNGTPIGLSILEEISRLPAENQVRAYKDYLAGEIKREDLKEYKAYKFSDGDISPAEEERLREQETSDSLKNKKCFVSYGFGTVNQFGNFITLVKGDVIGRIGINTEGFVKESNNCNYKVTIEVL
ncbi:MAG: ParB/RepB/Spo0J family partition protein [Sulfurospirillum sp.]